MAKKAVLVDVRKVVVGTTKDYMAVIAAMLWLPLEAIYWNNYKAFGTSRSIAHQNMY